MALGFGSTSGTGSTDAVISPYTAYPTTVSISVRFKQNSAQNGALVCKGTTNGSMSLNFASSGASIWLAVAAGGFDLSNSFSNGDGAYNYINTGTDQLLHHLLITWNFSSVNTNPTWYLDGVSQSNNVGQHSGGAVTTAYQTQAWQIGNSPNISGVGGIFDGTICDVGIWNVVLSNGLATAKALSAGLSPLAVQPSALVSYVPGFDAAARDWRAGASTLVGTPKVQNHLARPIMPRGRSLARNSPGATVAAGLTTATSSPATATATGGASVAGLLTTATGSAASGAATGGSSVAAGLTGATGSAAGAVASGGAATSGGLTTATASATTGAAAGGASVAAGMATATGSPATGAATGGSVVSASMAASSASPAACVATGGGSVSAGLTTATASPATAVASVQSLAPCPIIPAIPCAPALLSDIPVAETVLEAVPAGEASLRTVPCAPTVIAARAGCS